jgi:hypothetical protein
MQRAAKGVQEPLRGRTPFLGGSLGAGKIVSCVHERHVTESLRKISHLAFPTGVVLLAKQANVVPKSQQTLEHRVRFGEPPLQDQIVDEPEVACEECAFTGRQAVFGFARVVAKD